ncbi:MAG TPA: Mrp/NBP35 family ATP-binding protein [Polyangiaceae bacterium]|jgi:ATP-binding protein involved in chromosome partitioning
MSDIARALGETLATVRVPGKDETLGAAGVLGDFGVDGDGTAIVTLRVPYAGYGGTLEQEVQKAATNVPGVRRAATRVEVVTSWRSVAEDDPVPGVKNVVLVLSGKGGVGKSTVAANLALALRQLGATTGLLDADIYGPSVPTMFGVSGHPSSDGSKITPLERFGVKLMSIGFLLEEPKSAVVWRGPMLHGALLQFLKDVDWGTLDYLLLDLPPGTGDIALTLSQRVRSTGAIVVTTPQEVALQDVYKAVSMNQKVGIPTLGVVENESYFVCDGCDKRHELFGSGGGQKVAEYAQAPLLGQMALDPEVRRWGDAGSPIVTAAPDSDSARAFLSVARRVAERVAAHNAAASAGPLIDRSGGVNRRLPIAR